MAEPEEYAVAIPEEPRKDLPMRLLDNATLAELERAVANYQKLVGIALRLTVEGDWSNQNGKPYLEATGCEKVKTPFGVDWYGLELTKHDRGDYYFIQIKGRTRCRLLGGVEIEVMGTRASNDKFFCMRGGVLLPMEEVDEPDVMKSALSNFIVNAVTRSIGLRGLTWEQLEAAGLKKEKICAVEYKKRKENKAPEEKAKGPANGQAAPATSPSESAIPVGENAGPPKKDCPKCKEELITKTSTSQANAGRLFYECPKGCTKTMPDGKELNHWGWV